MVNHGHGILSISEWQFFLGHKGSRNCFLHEYTRWSKEYDLQLSAVLEARWMNFEHICRHIANTTQERKEELMVVMSFTYRF